MSYSWFDIWKSIKNSFDWIRFIYQSYLIWYNNNQSINCPYFIKSINLHQVGLFVWRVNRQTWISFIISIISYAHKDTFLCCVIISLHTIIIMWQIWLIWILWSESFHTSFEWDLNPIYLVVLRQNEILICLLKF